jgi:hypothetical protein
MSSPTDNPLEPIPPAQQPAIRRPSRTAGGNASELWRHGLILLLFLMAFSFAEGLLTLIAIAQFIWLAVQRQRNEFLAGFGRSLAGWLRDAALFLTGATDEKPFPWASWPTP